MTADDALVEKVAQALRNADNAALEETNFERLSATYDEAARAAVAAVMDELGLVEEQRTKFAGTNAEWEATRLVSPWREV